MCLCAGVHARCHRVYVFSVGKPHSKIRLYRGCVQVIFKCAEKLSVLIRFSDIQGPGTRKLKRWDCMYWKCCLFASSVCIVLVSGLLKKLCKSAGHSFYSPVLKRAGLFFVPACGGFSKVLWTSIVHCSSSFQHCDPSIWIASWKLSLTRLHAQL